MRDRILPAALLLLFMAAVIAASRQASRAWWGLAAPGEFAVTVGLIALLVVGCALHPVADRLLGRGLGALTGPRATAAVLATAVLLPAVSAAGRIRLPWLGDQSLWLRTLGVRDTAHLVEPGSYALVRAAWSSLGESGPAALSILLGAAFVLLAWGLAREITPEPGAKRVWLWLALLFVPQSLFFRGYVESYPYLLLTLMTLAWVLLRSLRGASLLWALLPALGACAAHVMGAAGALPLAHLAWRKRRWSAFAGAGILLALVAAWMFWGRSKFPAHIRSPQMVFSVFDLTAQGWERFLGWGHLRALANQILLLGGPLLWLAPVAAWGRLRGEHRRHATTLGLFLVPGLVGLLFLRLLLGAPRDWDLFASFLYFMTPLLASAWLLRAPAAALPRFSAALLVAAFLHAGFWSTVDADPQRGFRRAYRLYGPSSEFAPEARGRAAEELAIAERRRGNPEAELGWYRVAAKAMPKHWRYHHNVGAAALREGRTEEAREALGRAVDLSPGDPAPYRSLGSLHLQDGRPEAALDVYTRGLGNAGPDPDFHYGRGVALGMLGRDREAAAALDASLTLRPEDAPALLHRGAAALRLGEAEAAVRFLERSVAVDPRVPGGWQFLARAAQATGDSALAAEAGVRAREQNSGAEPRQ